MRGLLDGETGDGLLAIASWCTRMKFIAAYASLCAVAGLGGRVLLRRLRRG